MTKLERGPLEFYKDRGNEGEAEFAHEEWCFEWKFTKATTLWIHDGDGQSNLESLADLLLAYVRENDLDEAILFSVAWTCDKPRLDGFGGSALMVTKDGVQAKGTNNVMNRLEKEHKDPPSLKWDNGNDYTLAEHNHAWLTVGCFSLNVKHTATQIIMTLYPVGKEMDDPIMEWIEEKEETCPVPS